MTMNIAQLRQSLAPYRRMGLVQALVHPVIVMILYASAFLGALVLTSLPLRFAMSLAAALFAGNLFMIGHDACHGSYTPSRRLNLVLGRFAFLPSYTPFSLWALSHNRIHHVFTNLRERDFVWRPWSREEFVAASWLRRSFYRLCRSPLGLALYFSLEYWPERLIFPDKEYVGAKRSAYTLDRCLVAAFLVLQLGIVAWIGLGTDGYGSVPEWIAALMFGLMLPWLGFSWLFGFVTFFNHTNPAVRWFSRASQWSSIDGTVQGTVALRFPKRWQFTGNIMDHVAHHADPLVPLVRLRQAQLRLESLLGESVIVQEWNLSELREIFRRCCLYDYDMQCWLDYSGRQTTSPGKAL
jgi:acyl-lipid omega-6 desaturase (Delta-12 desaturase)